MRFHNITQYSLHISKSVSKSKCSGCPSLDYCFDELHFEPISPVNNYLMQIILICPKRTYVELSTIPPLSTILCCYPLCELQ